MAKQTKISPALVLILGVILGSLSLAPVDFAGEYQVTSIGVDPFYQTIHVTIEGNRIYVDGCRESVTTFGVLDDGHFRVSEFVSNGEPCNDDAEAKVLTAFSASLRIQRYGTVILLRTEVGGETMRLKLRSSLPSNPPEIDIPDTIPSIEMAGTYEILIEGFSTVKFFGKLVTNEIILSGCNSHRLNYRAYQNGDIIFSNVKSTLKQCPENYDLILLETLQEINSFKAVQPGQYYLYQGDLLLARLVPTTINPFPNPSRFFFDSTKIYRANVQGLSQSVELWFGYDQIRITGCNIYSYQYYAEEPNILRLSQPLLLSRNSCSNNEDSVIFNTLSRARYYSKTDNGYLFLEYQGSTQYLLQIVVPPAGRSQVSLEGSYSLFSTNNELTFKRGTVSFSDCAYHEFKYYELTNNQIEFYDYRTTGNQNPDNCASDSQQIFVKLIQNTQRYSIYAGTNTITFYDKSYKTTLMLTNLFNSIPSVNRLDGKYTMEVPRKVIKIEATASEFKLVGCNTYSIPYYADGNGIFSAGGNAFKGIKQTTKTCQDDYDAVFIRSIAISDSFQVNRGNVSFIRNSESVALARLIDVSPVKQPYTLASPTKTSFVSGTYRLRIVRSNIDPIEVSITQEPSFNVITLKGCDTYFTTYRAYSDSTFVLVNSEIRNSLSSNRCSESNDEFYLQLLESSKSFNRNSNGFYYLYNQDEKSVLELAPLAAGSL